MFYDFFVLFVGLLSISVLLFLVGGKKKKQSHNSTHNTCVHFRIRKRKNSDTSCTQQAPEGGSLDADLDLETGNPAHDQFNYPTEYPLEFVETGSPSRHNQTTNPLLHPPSTLLLSSKPKTTIVR